MNRKLLGAAATYSAANVLVAAFPLLLVPILTRLLSPHDYGVVALFMAAASFLTLVIGLGVQGLVPVEYHKLERAQVAQLVTACLTVGGASLVAVVLLLLLAPAALADAAGVPLRWLLVACAFAAMQFVIALRLSVLQAQDRSGRYAAAQLAQTLLGAALSIALIVLAGMAWQGRVAGLVGAAALLTLTAFIGLRQDGLLVAHADRRFLRMAARFGITLLPHVLGGLALAISDQVVVAALLGTDAAGLFAVALAVAGAIKVVTIALNRAWAPWLYEHLPGFDEAARRRVVRLTWAYFAIVAAASVAFGLLVPPLMAWLVGPAFAGSGDYIPALAIGFGFGGMYFAVTNYVFHAGATARLATVTAAAGAINLALSLLLVGRYGLAGAGYGFAIAQALLFFGTWRLSHHVCPMPWFTALRAPAAAAAG
ncbi:MAG: lipopolysaccharide biosynthesis protein [Gammaproteobacteria bacterium]